jgi:signal transduction histidine kinase
MFSKSFRFSSKTLGIRMMLWYSGILILSSTLIFLVAHWYLSSSLRERDHELIRSKLQTYAAEYEKGGTGSLSKALEEDGGKNNPFFVRLARSDNHTMLMNVPPDFYDDEDGRLVFDAHKAEKITQAAPLTTVTAEGGEDDILEIATVKLHDGSLIQVGRTAENREDTLETFESVFLAVLAAVIITGFLAGGFLTYRLLHPIRQLIATARSIIRTGRMDSRVSTGQTAGELQELVVLFNGALDRIESLIRGMRESLDNVAHDLRTPVTRLRGAAESALQSENPLEHKEALADSLEESDRLITMLNTLMDISEAEIGVMTLNMKVCNVSLMLDDIVDLYQYVGEEKGISIATDFPEEFNLCVDQTRFQQALANLLDNAIKYTNPGGTVFVEAKQYEKRINDCCS